MSSSHSTQQSRHSSRSVEPQPDTPAYRAVSLARGAVMQLLRGTDREEEERDSVCDDVIEKCEIVAPPAGGWKFRGTNIFSRGDPKRESSVAIVFRSASDAVKAYLALEERAFTERRLNGASGSSGSNLGRDQGGRGGSADDLRCYWLPKRPGEAAGAHVASPPVWELSVAEFAFEPSKRDYFWPFLPPAVRSQLRVDAEAAFSVTEQGVAELIAAVAVVFLQAGGNNTRASGTTGRLERPEAFFPVVRPSTQRDELNRERAAHQQYHQHHRQRQQMQDGDKDGGELWLVSPAPAPAGAFVMTDATACVGGNSLSFARYFYRVRAVEIDPERCNLLHENVELLGLSCRVECHATDWLQALRNGTLVDQDAVFLDPPWGGIDYRSKSTVPISLGSEALHDCVRLARIHSPRSRLFVMKLPLNADLGGFERWARDDSDAKLDKSRSRTQVQFHMCRLIFSKMLLLILDFASTSAIFLDHIRACLDRSGALEPLTKSAKWTHVDIYAALTGNRPFEWYTAQRALDRNAYAHAVELAVPSPLSIVEPFELIWPDELEIVRRFRLDSTDIFARTPTKSSKPEHRTALLSLGGSAASTRSSSSRSFVFDSTLPNYWDPSRLGMQRESLRETIAQMTNGDRPRLHALAYGAFDKFDRSCAPLADSNLSAEDVRNDSLAALHLSRDAAVLRAALYSALCKHQVIAKQSTDANALPSIHILHICDDTAQSIGASLSAVSLALDKMFDHRLQDGVEFFGRRDIKHTVLPICSGDQSSSSHTENATLLLAQLQKFGNVEILKLPDHDEPAAFDSSLASRVAFIASKLLDGHARASTFDVIVASPSSFLDLEVDRNGKQKPERASPRSVEVSAYVAAFSALALGSSAGTHDTGGLLIMRLRSLSDYQMLQVLWILCNAFSTVEVELPDCCDAHETQIFLRAHSVRSSAHGLSLTSIMNACTAWDSVHQSLFSRSDVDAAFIDRYVEVAAYFQELRECALRRPELPGHVRELEDAVRARARSLATKFACDAVSTATETARSDEGVAESQRGTKRRAEDMSIMGELGDSPTHRERSTEPKRART